MVERLNTGAVSCLHDYTLTVSDMKLIESADVIAMNGAGLEDFMDDALAAAKGTVIDCSEGVELLELLGHDHHDEDETEGEHYDPHFWMDPANAAIMAENLEKGLSQADPDNQQTYADNLTATQAQLESWNSTLQDMIQGSGGEVSGLVTFHDGFQYFAQAFDLDILKAIEEEEGSEASAQVINETVTLVKEHSIPVIFTEVNGSDATAQAIARETGVGRGHPYSNEKLGPILAFYTAENYEKVCEKVCEILHYEGAGHTFSMHTNDDKMVDYFARRVPASRVMVNTPSALGGIGGTTALQPALTLGCGAVGGSATSENVGPMHLLNLRYVAYGLKELDEIRASVPDCSDGICRTAPSLENIDVDDIVRQIIGKLQKL